MAACVLTRTIKAQALDVDIGNITELKGNTRVVRDKPYESIIDFSLNSYDRLETANGRMGVTFRDETTIRLTEHSQVVVDEFVFDPDLYLKLNPDVKTANVNPYEHYLKYGIKEKRRIR